jgi:hypothetical protein
MAWRGAVLAGAAHELNNPLAAIMGFSQLLLRRRWPLEDRTALEAIHHEALRSATIVKDLLALARRRGIERRAPADVNGLVAYIVWTRRYALETAGIVCELELGPTPPVRGDRTQLEQVILNLLNNAEQALRPRRQTRSTSQGRILIRTRHEEPDVVVEVEDKAGVLTTFDPTSGIRSGRRRRRARDGPRAHRGSHSSWSTTADLCRWSEARLAARDSSSACQEWPRRSNRRRRPGIAAARRLRRRSRARPSVRRTPRVAARRDQRGHRERRCALHRKAGSTPSCATPT